MGRLRLGDELDEAKDEKSMRRLIAREEKSTFRDWMTKRASAGQDEADRLLLERVYKIVRILERKGLTEVLGARIKEALVGHRRKISIDDQPFKQALLLFAGQAQGGNEAPFKKQRRYEWGNALAFAHSQNVRGMRVIEFIQQRGMKNCHLAWKKMRNKEG